MMKVNISVERESVADLISCLRNISQFIVSILPPGKTVEDARLPVGFKLNGEQWNLTVTEVKKRAEEVEGSPKDTPSNLPLETVKSVWRTGMDLVVDQFGELINHLNDEEYSKILTVVMDEKEKNFFEKFGMVFTSERNEDLYSTGGFPYKVIVYDEEGNAKE